MFVYDAIAPTIKLPTNYRVNKTAIGTYKGYRIDGLPLNDGNNIVTITGQDVAGNAVTAQVPVEVVELKKYSFDSFFGKSFKKCTEADHIACVFPTILEQGCEGMKKYKSCVEARCDNKVSIQNCE